MLLSVYLGHGFVSAVLFETNPFSVKGKVYIDIPYEADAFFSFSTVKQLEKVLVEKLKITHETFESATKLLISSQNNLCLPTGWKSIHTVEEIVDSVSGRILHFDQNQFEKMLENDRERLNDYANAVYYNYPLRAEILSDIFKKVATEYWEMHFNPKINLKEVIVSLRQYDTKRAELIENEAVKNFANACSQNKIIEYTFDYGYFLLPIIAALIDQKNDPKVFFKENPIHVDMKLIIIPNMKDQLEFENNKGDALADFERKDDLLHLDIEEGDIIIIKSKDPKKKVHLELLGCKHGIYLDDREKNADKK